MADEKKITAKAYDIFYLTVMTLAVAGFGFFGYLKLTDTNVYFNDIIVECYTPCLIAAFIFLALRVLIVYHKNGNKLKYQLWLLIISCIISGICLINSVAEDLSRSKVKEIIEINETTDILLCETGGEKNTQIDVYRIRGRMAKKIGEIDETYFSVKCIEQGQYSYTVSEDGSLITINCSYGVYGDGIRMIVPAYDTGTLSFTFEID